MTECREQSWLFQDLGSRKVEVDFGGGYLSSDGGGLILRELERHSGLIRDFADCFVDYRDQRYIEHSVQELVSQRLHGLVLGYEDLNDHDHLRLDPIHGLIGGKSDPLGQDRVLERDKGKALAAHSTLNRMELSAEALDGRYRKIKPSPIRSKGCSSSVESKPFHARALRSCWILMRPMIRSTAASKALIFTATIVTTATCRSTALAETFRFLLSCAIASATPAMARWRHSRR